MATSTLAAVPPGNYEPVRTAVAVVVQVTFKRGFFPFFFCQSLFFVFLCLCGLDMNILRHFKVGFHGVAQFRCEGRIVYWYLLYRLCQIGDDVLVIHHRHRKVLERPHNLLYRVCSVESGFPVGDLVILHQVMIFLCGHLFKARPCLVHRRFIVPLLQCKGVESCLFDVMICRLQD